MPSPVSPARTTSTTGEVKKVTTGFSKVKNTDAAERRKTTEKRTAVAGSTMVVLRSLRTLERMSAQTAARTPAKAWPTQGLSATWERKAAMTPMMTRQGKIRPRVAAMPPGTPFYFAPTKVAVLTAMMPGVHWPTA